MRRKFVAAFGEPFRLASLALQTSVAYDSALNRFRSEPPAGFQDQAMLVTGDLDTALSVISRVLSAQQVGSRKELKKDASPGQTDTLHSQKENSPSVQTRGLIDVRRRDMARYCRQIKADIENNSSVKHGLEQAEGG